MQNALQAALVSTGVATPITQKEQIWRVVKQDQPTNYKHIAKRTGLPETTVSSLLCDMERRVMVYSRGGPGAGPRGTRKEYLTELSTYESLPLPTAKPGLREMLIERLGPDAPAPRVHSSTPSAQSTADGLTVAQARELWLILNKMFGAQK